MAKEWHQQNTCFYLQGDVSKHKEGSVRIAAFDFDNTLVKFHNTSVSTLEEPLYQSIPMILEDYYKNGWIVVIFSNQKYPPSQYNKIKQRFMKFIKYLTFYPWIFIATQDDKYRKPSPNMFDLFLEKLVESEPELSDQPVSSVSFYCGDASGPEDSNPEYRWSDSDRRFAENIQLNYYRPDEVFED
jgi:DNA 3'-phosphatase